MRPLYEIAKEIKADWSPINNGGARDAISHMEQIGDVFKPYCLERSGFGVIGQFLSNAIGWQGPVARRVKKELRDMCSQKPI